LTLIFFIVSNSKPKEPDVLTLKVIDNLNLMSLWDWTDDHQFINITGRVSFHRNPKLCIKYIEELIDKKMVNQTWMDYYKSTNGDQTVCKC
jgi:hypothetical protein